jgi:hypothetical protein
MNVSRSLPRRGAPKEPQGDRGRQPQGAGSVTSVSSVTRTELAHRSSTGIDVTLLWLRDGDTDEALVCVSDRRNGAYFEIPAKPYLALDVYYHPFAYRDFGLVDYEDSRLAA